MKGWLLKQPAESRRIKDITPLRVREGESRLSNRVFSRRAVDEVFLTLESVMGNRDVIVLAKLVVGNHEICQKSSLEKKESSS